MNFEIIAVGFNADTDKTDDRVIWVKAPDADYMNALLPGVLHVGCTELPAEYQIGFDYTLPQDRDALVARLHHFARNLP